MSYSYQNHILSRWHLTLSLGWHLGLTNRSTTKSIINWCFNIRQYIATICDINMNPDVPQYKNCWKWGHLTLACCLYISRYTKCHEPHNTEHYREKAWCCKKNSKSNPPRLTIKEGKPCHHVFKCVNCKEDNQANSNSCSCWRNCFNKKWHGKIKSGQI